MKKVFLAGLAATLVFSCGTKEQKYVEVKDSAKVDEVAVATEVLQVSSSTIHGFSGCDEAEILETGNTSICKYRNWTVKVEIVENEMGETITAISKDNSVNQVLNTAGNPAYYYGIYKNFVFIDEGTGPDERGFSIVDLIAQKVVLTIIIADEKPQIVNNKLILWETLDKIEANQILECPDATNWEKEGWMVAYKEKVTFNFSTQKIERSNEIKCFQTQ